METIQIEDQIFEIRSNVKSQTSSISTSELFFEYYESNNNVTHNNAFFLLFETTFDCAFGHWVFESAIYLTYFFELKSKYPELKILVKKNPKRSYKKLFLDALNIGEDDIYWFENEETNDCKTVYDNIPTNNICINTKPQCLNTAQLQNKKEFKELILKFKNKILSNLNIVYPPPNKTIEHLFFPRSQKENYMPNDRNINYDRAYKLLKDKIYTTYDTINTTNLKDQIDMLVLSQHVYLDFGSSFFVNGLFCTNSTIFVSATMEFQRRECQYISLLEEINREFNNVIVYM